MEARGIVLPVLRFMFEYHMRATCLELTLQACSISIHCLAIHRYSSILIVSPIYDLCSPFYAPPPPLRAGDTTIKNHNNTTITHRYVKTLKDGIYFTTYKGANPLAPLSSRYAELCDSYDEKQADLEAKAVEVARTFMPVLEAAAKVTSELDVFVSFAHVAVNSMGGEYVRPTMTQHKEGSAECSEEGIALTKARHPCMEAVEGASAEFIPNDYSLERGKSQFQIVTGPNMGGKMRERERERERSESELGDEREREREREMGDVKCEM